MTDGTYRHNKETGRIELYFDKPTYQALTPKVKDEIKRNYLWSPTADCWLSRSTRNHTYALIVAKSAGLTDGGTTGERLPFAEQMERKVEKAQARAERFEDRAHTVEQKGNSLCAELDRYTGDIAFFTQPIMKGHAGSERFARFRQRLRDRYSKGMEELKKCDYYRERAATATATTQQRQLQNPAYLQRRIEENHAALRDLVRRLEKYGAEHAAYADRLQDAIEETLDKLTYYQSHLDTLGGIAYSRENVHKGDLVNLGWGWQTVVRANAKTVSVKLHETYTWTNTYPYAEIRDHRPVQENPPHDRDTEEVPAV